MTHRFRATINSRFKSMSAGNPCGLPIGYEPNKFDIICGRGRGLYRQSGNAKFHTIIMASIEEYKRKQTRIEKTGTINKIIEAVLSQNSGNCHFIKQIGVKQWDKVGVNEVREKVGHAIREAMSMRGKGKPYLSKQQRLKSNKNARRGVVIASQNTCTESDFSNEENGSKNENSNVTIDPIPLGSCQSADALSASDIVQLLGFLDCQCEEIESNEVIITQA
jgi:hypothetical protein